MLDLSRGINNPFNATLSEGYTPIDLFTVWSIPDQQGIWQSLSCPVWIEPACVPGISEINYTVANHYWFCIVGIPSEFYIEITRNMKLLLEEVRD